MRLLNAPASDALVAAVSGDFEDRGEWKECKQLFSCIYQREKLSHLILVFMHLSNHTPGGAHGEGRTNLAELVAFLSSPWNRIAVVFTAALYPKHMEWARFADGVSGTHTDTTRVISTRMIEAPPFERELIKHWKFKLLTTEQVENEL